MPNSEKMPYLRFQVAMQDALAVTKTDPAQKLIEVALRELHTAVRTNRDDCFQRPINGTIPVPLRKGISTLASMRSTFCG